MIASRTITALVAFGAICTASEASESAPPCNITITSPVNNGTVGKITPVLGVLSPQAAIIGRNNVWVVIRPDGADFWVQRPAQAANGEWMAATQFGTAATPPGFHFEIQALVGPTLPLKEGDQLAAFPSAACSSGIVHVLRR